MNARINIGIAGTGWITEKVYIPLLSESERVNLVSFYEPLDGRRKQAQQLYQAHNWTYYGCYDDFLQSGINCVIIATPNATHQELSVKALLKGLHVLCEKPVALTKIEISSVIEAAKKGQAVYMPGFVNRFRQDIQLLKDLTDSNVIGEPLGIRAGWLRKDGIPRLGSWFTRKELAGGGPLMDLGSHILDICCMLLGNSFQEKSAVLKTAYGKEGQGTSAAWFQNQCPTNSWQMDVESAAFAVIKGSNQSIRASLCWDAPVSGDLTYFYIEGTKGMLKYRSLFGFSTNRLCQDTGISVIHRNGDKDWFETGPSCVMEAFADMISCFLDQILGIGRKEVGPEDAYKNVVLIEKLYQNERIIR